MIPNSSEAQFPVFLSQKLKWKVIDIFKKLNGSLMDYILIINKCHYMFNYFIIFIN